MIPVELNGLTGILLAVSQKSVSMNMATSKAVAAVRMELEEMVLFLMTA